MGPGSALLEKNNQAHREGKGISTSAMLMGKLFDPHGVRFTPTHAVKGGKRHRYYTSRAAIEHTHDKPSVARLPAHQLENIVLAQVRRLLEEPHKWKEGLKDEPAESVAVEQAGKLVKRWSTMPFEQRYEII